MGLASEVPSGQSPGRSPCWRERRGHFQLRQRTSERASARRCVAARRPSEETDPEPTLFTWARYLYRAWIRNRPLSAAGVWHFYDGRAGMEPRIRELREDFALRKSPPARLRPTPFIWKSFAWPTIW